MPSYLSPGIYMEEVDRGSKPIEAVGTAVAAFIGYTARGPVNQPVHIFSFADFERAFGGLAIDSPLSYAVKLFFQNGGNEACVADLGGGEAAFGVHGVGEAAQAGDGFAVEDDGVAMDATSRGDRAVGDGGQCRTTASHLGVELDEFVGDRAERHDPFEGGRLDDAVTEREWSESSRFEHLGSRRRHGPTFDASGIVIAVQL